MILLNEKLQEITLKAIFDECVEVNNKLIIKENEKTTLVSEEKMIYAYFSKQLNFRKTYNFIKKFVKENKYNINIDVNSFKKNSKENDQIFKAISEGLFYGTYKAFTLKTTVKNENEIIYNLIYDDNEYTKNEFKEIKIKMESVNLARLLQDTPPNLMYPEAFVNKIIEITKNIPNLKITILNKKEIEKEKMGLLLSVNAGSYFEPYIIVIEYIGDIKIKEKIGLIGKGITFDSGGYNLKPSSAMLGMKFDMSGAAIVCATMIALAKIKAKVNIIGVVCITENRIGGKATLTESVIKSMNGKTVQIDNTDAEGRLILADGITYAIRKLNTDKLIEISTLTGAILITLGKNITGTFTNNKQWYKKFVNASKKSHEEIWRLPIHEVNKEAIRKTPIADLTNSDPSKMGGSSSAAAFLCEFVENRPFIHLDIAGTADENNERGTGVMVKTLFEMFK